MNKLYILSILIFLCSIKLYSQDYSVEWGPTYKKETSLFSQFGLLGIDKGHYFLLFNPKKKNLVQTYNMKHELVSSNQLDMKFNGNNLKIEKIIKTKSSSFGQMAAYDKKQKKIRLFVSELKEGVFGKHREVFSHEYLRQIGISFDGITSSSNSDKSSLVESADGSHVVYINVQSTIDKVSKEKLSIAVFDADMNIVWQKIQQFRYKDKTIDINQVFVSNDGTVYLLAKVKGESKITDHSDYTYKAFKISRESMREYKISLGDGHTPIALGLLSPNNDKEFVITGFYAATRKINAILGAFHASGNSETGIRNINKEGFDQTVLDGLATKNQIKNNKGIRKYFKIKNLLQFPDNSIAFIAESYRIELSSVTTGLNGQVNHDYTKYADELIISKFNANGEILKIQKIEKSYPCSICKHTYLSGAINDKIYIIFNDLKSREDLKSMGKKAKKNCIYTDLVVIDKDGEVEHRETLFNSEDIEFQFSQFLSLWSEDKILIGSTSNSGLKYAFGTLNIE